MWIGINGYERMIVKFPQGECVIHVGIKGHQVGNINAGQQNISRRGTHNDSETFVIVEASLVNTRLSTILFFPLSSLKALNTNIWTLKGPGSAT